MAQYNVQQLYRHVPASSSDTKQIHGQIQSRQEGTQVRSTESGQLGKPAARGMSEGNPDRARRQVTLRMW